MMGTRPGLKKTKVLSASEIGQYVYCSQAWFLRRCGCIPESPFLEAGKQAHVALGQRLDRFEGTIRYARWLLVVGGAALLLAFLLFFFEVIL